MNENNERPPHGDEISDQQRERIAREQPFDLDESMSNAVKHFGIDPFWIGLEKVKGKMFIRKDNRQKRRKKPVNK